MRKNEYREPPFELDRSRYGDLAVQIASGLRKAIETGYYRAGEILPPGRDLAMLLGVSKGIAEQALALVREEGLISPRPRIGSVVCAKDRPLWKGQVLVVVPPGIGNPIDNVVHSALREALVAAGYLVTSATVPFAAAGKFTDFAQLETMLRQQIDLVVLLHCHPAIEKWLEGKGTPYVRLARGNAAMVTRTCLGTVLFNPGLALEGFVRRCREAGVRSAVHVGAWRLPDISAALAPLGAKVTAWRAPRPGGMMPNALDLAQWAADTFARRLAGRRRPALPDLFFFDDDHLTNGALMALAEAGVRIPGDVRVATWANRNYGPVFTKPLSRMEMDNAAIGVKLSECVLEYLRDDAFPQGVEVGPTWIDGETF